MTKQIRAITLLLFLLLLAAGTAFGGSPIQWEQNSIMLTGVSGKTATTSISFVVTEKSINHIVFAPSGLIEPYITISPATFSHLKKGQRITLLVTISVPDAAPPGTKSGFIQVRKEKNGKAYGESLSVRLNLEPEVLPVDPAEEGKVTLAGIDADSDGVRDDIQRYIALTYWDKPDLKAALRQYAVPLQQALLEADSEEAALVNTEELGRAFSCIEYRTMSLDDAGNISDKLKIKMLNTKERSKAYLLYNQQLGGNIFPGLPLPTADLCQ